ncbi:hypothetical protein [Wolbachia endosymbiont of Pentidionis agamae]|uniref:hypothetical protein n=1 Tax=Wolbachia endosymbiont of Pentidionis agamae TaxID=3110435 RepID=UPI002FD209B8
MSNGNKTRANEVRIGLTALALAINPISGAVVGTLALTDFISNGKISEIGKNVLDKVRDTASNVFKKIGWSENKDLEKEKLEDENKQVNKENTSELSTKSIESSQSMEKNSTEETTAIGYHTSKVLSERGVSVEQQGRNC